MALAHKIDKQQGIYTLKNLGYYQQNMVLSTLSISYYSDKLSFFSDFYCYGWYLILLIP